MNKVVWGKVADQDPRIVSLLRTLRARQHVPPEEVQRAFEELDGILQEWIDTENLSRLRIALGVKGSRGGRRTQIAVSRELDLVLQIVNAALSGRDVSNYRKAADVLGVEDEKTIERAWRQWSSLQMANVVAVANSGVSFAVEYRDAIARLPAVVTSRRDTE
jgi:hypothetical protein